MDERSVEFAEDDEIGKFIRATSCLSRSTDPLQWWKENEHRYLNVAEVARDGFAIQASSMSSDSTFSHANRVLEKSRL